MNYIVVLLHEKHYFRIKPLHYSLIKLKNQVFLGRYFIFFITFLNDLHIACNFVRKVLEKLVVHLIRTLKICDNVCGFKVYRFKHKRFSRPLV